VWLVFATIRLTFSAPDILLDDAYLL